MGILFWFIILVNMAYIDGQFYRNNVEIMPPDWTLMLAEQEEEVFIKEKSTEPSVSTHVPFTHDITTTFENLETLLPPQISTTENGLSYQENITDNDIKAIIVSYLRHFSAVIFDSCTLFSRHFLNIV